MFPQIKAAIQAGIEAKTAFMNDEPLLERIDLAAHWLLTCFQHQGKVLLCGNGGSAADAQHIAAELSGRFYADRPPLFAEALHVNSSYITAVANDYGYDEVFARMVEAAGRPGDILVAISTSGRSESIVRAAQRARVQGLKVIALTGSEGRNLADHSDLILNMPSADTPRIQELHILTGHILCQIIEAELFKR